MKKSLFPRLALMAVVVALSAHVPRRSKNTPM